MDSDFKEQPKKASASKYFVIMHRCEWGLSYGSNVPLKSYKIVKGTQEEVNKLVKQLEDSHGYTTFVADEMQFEDLTSKAWSSTS